ncbi:hypothetical protein HYQ45_008592 [Verticillium longisporum]|uniref:CipC-like antibiotic response protein n=1 Tax=Verticillium longisporum TaxID=100787 RepID=A0A8I2ZK74_VERLO|nr:hypothetical protein HYQ45_008592 [Verticillium longisporum]
MPWSKSNAQTDEAKDNYDNAYRGDHESKLSHEIVAGGAAFGAMKLFEDRQRKNGEPVHHAFAKELLAGFAGAEVDKLVETKGLDYIDREKAKRHAEKQAESLYENQYGDLEQYDPREREPHRHIREDRGYSGYGQDQDQGFGQNQSRGYDENQGYGHNQGYEDRRYEANRGYEENRRW